MKRSTGMLNKWVANRYHEPYDVYVGRGTPFGNPFKIGTHGSRQKVISTFEQMLLDDDELMEKVRRELKGKVLGCSCKPKLCHAHVLAWYANGFDEGPSD
jgi:hypothetical protein